MVGLATFLQRQPQRLQRLTHPLWVHLAIGENRVELVLPQGQAVLAHHVASKRFNLAPLVRLDSTTQGIPLALSGPQLLAGVSITALVTASRLGLLLRLGRYLGHSLADVVITHEGSSLSSVLLPSMTWTPALQSSAGLCRWRMRNPHRVSSTYSNRPCSSRTS